MHIAAAVKRARSMTIRSARARLLASRRSRNARGLPHDRHRTGGRCSVVGRRSTARAPGSWTRTAVASPPTRQDPPTHRGNDARDRSATPSSLNAPSPSSSVPRGSVDTAARPRGRPAGAFARLQQCTRGRVHHGSRDRGPDRHRRHRRGHPRRRVRPVLIERFVKPPVRTSASGHTVDDVGRDAGHHEKTHAGRKPVESLESKPWVARSTASAPTALRPSGALPEDRGHLRADGHGGSDDEGRDPESRSAADPVEGDMLGIGGPAREQSIDLGRAVVAALGGRAEATPVVSTLTRVERSTPDKPHDRQDAAAGMRSQCRTMRDRASARCVLNTGRFLLTRRRTGLEKRQRPDRAGKPLRRRRRRCSRGPRPRGARAAPAPESP